MSGAIDEAVDLGFHAAGTPRPGITRPKLSLVFPLFDEEENVEALLQSAIEIGEHLGGDFEVVVVDDGSQDRSPDILGTWRARESRLRVIHHSSNTGYGAALRTGLRVARGELVFFSDADLQFDLHELEALLTHTDRFDVVAGYRSPRRDPWPRGLIAAVWGLLVRGLFGLAVRDINCAFKVFHRDVLEAIPIASLGAFVNTEVLVRAQAAGFRIKQIPVTHRRRQNGSQSGAHPRVICRALVELGQLFRELRTIRRSDGAAARGEAN